MARLARYFVGGQPQHLIQRGNNREPKFVVDDDYRFYLHCLHDACVNNNVDLHAYVLMTNHSHLLMTPRDEWGISRVMQSLGRRYVQYFNDEYKRSGTLWESRHKSSIIDAERYLMSCYRYIELNPVRANMVAHPGQYRWTSYANNARGKSNNLLTPHEIYLALGSAPDKRRYCYRELFKSALDVDEIHAIRNAAQYSMPLGDNRFRQQIERVLGRCIGHANRGRPKKQVAR